MKIKEFGVEIWMNAYETQCRYNLAETCVDSITIGQLLEFGGKTGTILGELLPMKMTYGAIEGSERLRDLIASLYDNQQRHNVIVTHGAIGANALVYETLVEPGDHVVSVAPTYQQHYSIPQSYGAEVSILRLREENAFLPDPDELRGMVRANTKVIALNNPNNPTGSLMGRALLEEVVEIARSVDAWLLCDEVYRGTDQHGAGFTVSIADLYEKGISTEHVQDLLPGGAAPGLDRRAAGADPCRVDPSRLQHDQRRHARRSLRLHRPGKTAGTFSIAPTPLPGRTWRCWKPGWRKSRGCPGSSPVPAPLPCSRSTWTCRHERSA
ncbi:aminotransferase class I/II-fold pyridoxal phosphate-dependent enzyme [Pseudomonas bharatica]|uniref:aminotransferase class I/II-fold pyridoxal phosphate-dependent enzyme n=1 Tax=Pseudomonas bharatica TaxID=2692112 RepID=UPI000304EE89|nr:aminotransferase class I/II-fold pyridoxal phosphate-dependent enzyme [Pseudomonas bharatica]